MKDLISRQAAIEAFKEDKIDLTNPNVVAVFKATGDFEKVETQVMTCDRHIKMLKDLPSAQPEIIHCKDCKWSDWYDAADGHRYCYCMETGAAGRTADDFCSYAECEEVSE